jgi:hypothetical protein
MHGFCASYRITHQAAVWCVDRNSTAGCIGDVTLRVYHAMLLLLLL